MTFKRVAIFFASFGLMAQISPSEPDGTMPESICKTIAKQCIENHAFYGYSTGAECFDDRTGGNCPPRGGDDGIDRVWMWYEGPINRCTNPCWY